MERRYIGNSDLHIDFSGPSPKWIGYASVFNSPSEILVERKNGQKKVFREVIRPSAFEGVLKDPGTDVTFNMNHDDNFILDRYPSGGLSLSIDQRGLRVEAPVDLELSFARDLKRQVQKGAVTGMSFAFNVQPEGEVWRQEGNMTFRDVLSVSSLQDVSIVSHPAYKAASVSVRSQQAFEDFEESLLGDDNYKMWLEIQQAINTL